MRSLSVIKNNKNKNNFYLREKFINTVEIKLDITLTQAQKNTIAVFTPSEQSNIISLLSNKDSEFINMTKRIISNALNIKYLDKCLHLNYHQANSITFALNAGQASKEFVLNHFAKCLKLNFYQMIAIIDALNDDPAIKDFVLNNFDKWLKLNGGQISETTYALKDRPAIKDFVLNNLNKWLKLNDGQMLSTRNALNIAPQLVMQNITRWVNLDAGAMQQELRPYQTEDAREFNANNEQSVHSTAIQHETIDLFDYIKANTKVISPYQATQTFNKFKEDLVALNNKKGITSDFKQKIAAALKFLDSAHFNSDSKWNDNTIKQILAIVIQATQHTNHTSNTKQSNSIQWMHNIDKKTLINDHMLMLIDALYESKNAYNINDNGVINPQSNARSASCWGGAINRIILSLQSFINRPEVMPKQLPYANSLAKAIQQVLIDIAKSKNIQQNSITYKILQAVKQEVEKLPPQELYFSPQIFSIIEKSVRNNLKASFPACREQSNKQAEQELWTKSTDETFKQNVLPYIEIPKEFISRFCAYSKPMFKVEHGA
jgi:hypothetical protein